MFSYRAPISFFWPRNTNRVITAPLPVFSILGNFSPGPTRTRLEIRKDREISTRVASDGQYFESKIRFRSFTINAQFLMKKRRKLIFRPDSKINFN